MIIGPVCGSKFIQRNTPLTTAVIDLGGNQDLVPAFSVFDGLTDYALTLPLSIDISRVDQIDTHIQSTVYDPNGFIRGGRISKIVTS